MHGGHEPQTHPHHLDPGDSRVSPFVVMTSLLCSLRSISDLWCLSAGVWSWAAGALRSASAHVQAGIAKRRRPTAPRSRVEPKKLKSGVCLSLLPDSWLFSPPCCTFWPPVFFWCLESVPPSNSAAAKKSKMTSSAEEDDREVYTLQVGTVCYSDAALHHPCLTPHLVLCCRFAAANATKCWRRSTTVWSCWRSKWPLEVAVLYWNATGLLTNLPCFIFPVKPSPRRLPNWSVPSLRAARGCCTAERRATATEALRLSLPFQFLLDF